MYKYNYVAKEFGRRLKDIRKKNGVTQQQLAEQLNLSVDSVSNFENGKTTCMPDHITKICQIFNISADYFYFSMEKQLVEKTDSEFEKIMNMLKSCSDFDIERISRMIQIMLEQPAA